MSRPFVTICPHCQEEITVPYEALSRHLHQELGRRSAAKRADLAQHVSQASRRRWDAYTHPKQDALIALARSEDLSGLPWSTIADKLGITGTNRGVTVKKLVSRLTERGLLADTSLTGPPVKQQQILELLRTSGQDGLTPREIAQAVGYTGPHGERYVHYHLKQLREKGLLPDTT